MLKAVRADQHNVVGRKCEAMKIVGNDSKKVYSLFNELTQKAVERLVMRRVKSRPGCLSRPTALSSMEI